MTDRQKAIIRDDSSIQTEEDIYGWSEEFNRSSKHTCRM